MQFHNVEVLRELLLKHGVLRDAGEGTSCAEGGAILESEILLEVERGDLAKAGDESFAGAVDVGGDLLGGMLPDVIEAMVGVGDGGEVREEIGSGDLRGSFGRDDRGKFGRGEGGGRKRVVEDGREALDGIGIGFGEGRGRG